VPGPQERYFNEGALVSLFGDPYFVTADLTRMAVRLEGPKLSIAARLDMPSEGILRGAIQVPGSGDPIVLMADHQTTGGYPKIATMISADQDAFAQLRPHQPVQFRSVSVDYAVNRARTRQKALRQYLASIENSA
jgi:allophanate hydrolase